MMRVKITNIKNKKTIRRVTKIKKDIIFKITAHLFLCLSVFSYSVNIY